jgi:hypothetical protein
MTPPPVADHAVRCNCAPRGAAADGEQPRGGHNERWAAHQPGVQQRARDRRHRFR